MIVQKLKLNQAYFEYYILTISANTTEAQIEDKLTALNTITYDNKVLIVDFDINFKQEDIEVFVKCISLISQKLNIVFHSIIKSSIMDQSNILNIPIITLPNAKIKNLESKTLIISEPVRSGMKIEHEGDIVITSFVSDNAEVIALGNIHVYGEVRGRLIAGKLGDKTSRIFVKNFDAQLIAIGGVYRVIENRLTDNITNKSVMILLDKQDKLKIVPV